MLRVCPHMAAALCAFPAVHSSCFCSPVPPAATEAIRTSLPESPTAAAAPGNAPAASSALPGEAAATGGAEGTTAGKSCSLCCWENREWSVLRGQRCAQTLQRRDRQPICSLVSSPAADSVALCCLHILAAGKCQGCGHSTVREGFRWEMPSEVTRCHKCLSTLSSKNPNIFNILPVVIPFPNTYPTHFHHSPGNIHTAFNI